MGVSSLFPLYGIVNGGMEHNGMGEALSSALIVKRKTILNIYKAKKVWFNITFTRTMEIQCF